MPNGGGSSLARHMRALDEAKSELEVLQLQVKELMRVKRIAVKYLKAARWRLEDDSVPGGALRFVVPNLFDDVRSALNALEETEDNGD